MSLSPDQKLAAYLLGRRIAGQRRKQDRVPVAYLYNGVRLPGLPKEWNPVTQPFTAVIKVYSPGTLGYRLVACASATEIASTSGNGKVRFPGISYTWYWDSDNPDAWSKGAIFEYTDLEQVLTNIKWANHEIPNIDGTVYLEASDPVPVYE